MRRTETITLTFAHGERVANEWPGIGRLMFVARSELLDRLTRVRDKPGAWFEGSALAFDKLPATFRVREADRAGVGAAMWSRPVEPLYAGVVHEVVELELKGAAELGFDLVVRVEQLGPPDARQLPFCI